jgi:rubrerythrin
MFHYKPRRISTMLKFKNFSDVLEVAVRIERQGADFYNKLSSSPETPQVKDVFSFLASQEEKHAGVFRQILEEVADYSPRFNYPGEYGLFIEGVASRLLDKIEKAVVSLPAGNENEVLDIGIEFEKETILFYLEIKSENKLSPKEDKALQKVIDEERSHWQKLISLKNKLKF